MAKPDGLGLGIKHEAIQQSKVWHNINNLNAVAQPPCILELIPI